MWCHVITRLFHTLSYYDYFVMVPMTKPSIYYVLYVCLVSRPVTMTRKRPGIVIWMIKVISRDYNNFRMSCNQWHTFFVTIITLFIFLLLLYFPEWTKFGLTSAKIVAKGLLMQPNWISTARGFMAPDCSVTSVGGVVNLTKLRNCGTTSDLIMPAKVKILFQLRH